MPNAKIALAYVLLSALLLGAAEQAQGTENSVERFFRFQYMLTNDSSSVIDGAEFSVQIPVKRTYNQVVKSVQASRKYTLEEDDIGNQRMVFEINGLAPYSLMPIEIETVVVLGRNNDPLEAEVDPRYLLSESYIELSADEIKTFSRKFESVSPEAAIGKISKWIERNIEKASYTPNKLGALEALRSKSGDCTEFMYLGIAAARMNNIPARALSGFVYNGNSSIKSNNYHDWYEVYLDGAGWRIIDSFFGQKNIESTEYLAMYVANPSTTDTIATSRYSLSDSRVSVIAR